MNNETFNNIVSDRLAHVKDTLTAKADEYARGDRLSNFKKIADMLDSTPEKALIGLVSKHWIALLDFIADLNKPVIQPYQRWDEKTTDIMAYMVLLDALVQERITHAQTQYPDRP